MRRRSTTASDIAPDRKVLVTVAEAAAMLSIGRTAIYQLVGRNQLVSIRIGRTRRVLVSSLHDYAERLANGAS